MPVGIFERIKQVDTNINDNNKLVNSVVDKMKSTKLGRNILHEFNYNLNISRNKAEQPSSSESNIPVNSSSLLNKSLTDEQKMIQNDLESKLNRMDLKSTRNKEQDSERIKQALEKQNKFYTIVRRSN